MQNDLPDVGQLSLASSTLLDFRLQITFKNSFSLIVLQTSALQPNLSHHVTKCREHNLLMSQKQ